MARKPQNQNLFSNSEADNRPAAGSPGNPGSSSTGRKPRKPAGAGVGGNRPAGANPAAVELMAQKWEATKAQAKALYAAADLLEEELISTVGAGGLVRLSDNRVLQIVDNFTDKTGAPKNKAYAKAPQAVKRFAVELK